ncbi:amidohydrolase family protein [Vibrio sp. 10N.286.51.E5]|uniref:metal-dependent hydrolase family protein n=1 Tax=Vibrio sp. 10N.286.51.E5 TaxID=3229709 RepID=UPI0035502974
MNKQLLASSIVVGLSLGMNIAHAQEGSNLILIQNVNVFDGVHDKLKKDHDVLVKDNLIQSVGKDITAPAGAKIIDGDGRTLTPGFIDSHTHLQWNLSIAEHMYTPMDYQGAIALVDSEATLMRGFTTIRDVGGSMFGVKRAIDEGYFPGPRIYSSGAAIGMTAGHGDMRAPSVAPRMMGGPSTTEIETAGVAINADGVDEALTAARMQFRKGAAFLKFFAGGAVSGLYDPLDISEYSKEEMEAIVGEAERWNTYAAVHTYTDASTQAALEAGAKTLEHVNLISEDTMKLAVKKGAYIGAQTGVYMSPAPASFTPAQVARQQQAKDGLDNLMKLAKKHDAKILFGSDMVGSLEQKRMHLTEFTNRTKWFTNAEILQQATSVNAEVLELTGPRNPYPEAKLGVIENGAYADILLIDGNPLEDISILTNPEENLDLIMKDGEIFKNTIN